MIPYQATIDARPMIANVHEFQRRHLLTALVFGLNDAAFDVRGNWQKRMPGIFDRPTPLTVGAVLVRKATKAELVADVYIRDEAFKGTPPARYILAQVTGGPRRAKPHEAALRRAGILAPNEFTAPAQGLALDAFGNVPSGLIKQMLSDLQAASDPKANATQKSLRRKNRSKKQEFAQFFESAPKFSASQGHNQPLPRGIFQRRSTGFVGPSRGGSVRMVLAIVTQPTYVKRFDVRELTEKVFREAFPKRFQSALDSRLGKKR